MYGWKAVRGWSDYSNRISFRCFIISSRGIINQYRLHLSFVLVFSLLHLSLHGKTGSPWQSFQHGRWAIYEGLWFLTYSLALLSEGCIRGFHSVLGSHKARLPRMQLLRQFLLRVLILSFFFLRTLGQKNSVQTFGWKFKTDVSKLLPWALRCIWILKSESLSSLCRLIYRHVKTSVLSSSQIPRVPRIQLLGTILVLLLIIWWPFQIVVNHLPHLLELTTTLFPGFHSIRSVKRGSWSFYEWLLTFNLAGTRLILQMVDSFGNTGGTGASIYEVVKSKSSGSLQKDAT